jgi:D-alanine--poly(phosphoribitol) ligase subunit 2
MDNSIVQKLIYDAIDDINKQTPDELRLTKSPETILFGQKGKLDSFGLVSFIVAVEEKIQDELGKVVTIADEKAFSQKNSPFRTVGTLADYISSLIEEGANE